MEQIINYNITDAAIAEMKEQYGTLVIETKEDYEKVRLAIRDVVSWRCKVEQTRKDLKANALEWGKRVDTEAKRITALLVDIEEPLKAKKKEVDDIEEAKKAEKARIERERVENIQDKINIIRAYASDLLTVSDLKNSMLMRPEGV